MRFVTGKRLAVFSTLLVALVLCVAFVSNAFASTIQPHISVNRTHAVTDANGCATFRFSGSGFTESTNTVTNAALLRVDDPPFFDEDAYFANSGSNSTYVIVNKEGKFTATLVICDSGGGDGGGVTGLTAAAPDTVTAPDHWVVSSVDAFTGLPGNSVTLLVD